MTSHLPTIAEFRVLRDVLALEMIQQRLPTLNAEIEALRADLAPLFDALQECQSKHDKEKCYACFDGRDWRLWQLESERRNMMKRLEGL